MMVSVEKSSIVPDLTAQDAARSARWKTCRLRLPMSVFDHTAVARALLTDAGTRPAARTLPLSGARHSTSTAATIAANPERREPAKALASGSNPSSLNDESASTNPPPEGLARRHAHLAGPVATCADRGVMGLFHVVAVDVRP